MSTTKNKEKKSFCPSTKNYPKKKISDRSIQNFKCNRKWSHSSHNSKLWQHTKEKLKSTPGTSTSSVLSTFYFDSIDVQGFNEEMVSLDNELEDKCLELDLIDEMLVQSELKIAKLNAQLIKFNNLGNESTKTPTRTEPKDVLLTPAVQELVCTVYDESGINIPSDNDNFKCPPINNSNTKWRDQNENNKKKVKNITFTETVESKAQSDPLCDDNKMPTSSKSQKQQAQTKCLTINFGKTDRRDQNENKEKKVKNIQFFETVECKAQPEPLYDNDKMPSSSKSLKQQSQTKYLPINFNKTDRRDQNENKEKKVKNIQFFETVESKAQPEPLYDYNKIASSCKTPKQQTQTKCPSINIGKQNRPDQNEKNDRFFENIPLIQTVKCKAQPESLCGDNKTALSSKTLNQKTQTKYQPINTGEPNRQDQNENKEKKVKNITFFDTVKSNALLGSLHDDNKMVSSNKTLVQQPQITTRVASRLRQLVQNKQHIPNKLASSSPSPMPESKHTLISPTLRKENIINKCKLICGSQESSSNKSPSNNIFRKAPHEIAESSVSSCKNIINEINIKRKNQLDECIGASSSQHSRHKEACPCLSLCGKPFDTERKSKMFSKLKNGKRCFPDISEIQMKDQMTYMAERDAYLLFRRTLKDRANECEFQEKPDEFEIFFFDYINGASKINIPICPPNNKEKTAPADIKYSFAKLNKIQLDPALQRNVGDLALDICDKDPELIALLMNEEQPIWIDPMIMYDLVTPISLQKQLKVSDVRITAPGSVVPKSIPIQSLNMVNTHVMDEVEAIIKSNEYLYPDHEKAMNEIKDVIITPPERKEESKENVAPENYKCKLNLLPFRVQTYCQLRGASLPLWYPGMFTAFPDGNSSVKLVNTPSTLMYTAWKLSAP